MDSTPDAPAAKDYIKLDQFLKWQGLAESGGSAKALVTEGKIKVNGEVETRRGRKLRNGDTVQLEEQTLHVALEEKTRADKQSPLESVPHDDCSAQSPS